MVTGIGSAPEPNTASSADGGGRAPTVATVATVTPDDGWVTGTAAEVGVQISLTVHAANGVLATPISSLLALAGGGYGVEVVTPSGAHHLVAVTTGAFSGSQVQVSGRGIAAGTKVVVAQ
jgi:hypothetical protein